MQTEYSIAVDVGWKNLGIALLSSSSKGIEVVHSATLNPSTIDPVKRCQQILMEVGSKVTPKLITHATFERYASYSGVHTAESENILMLLGGLVETTRQLFYGAEIEMIRAIEWKMELAKTLFKLKGFQNPSNKLDKVFSIAAAHAVLDIDKELKDDHQADAVCLGSMVFIRKALAEKAKRDKLTSSATLPG
jgi:hypothetical protein